ncbi:Uncharacterised protein [Enterobacter hormaechei]|nr:Uncharacterised protein [Enterobacter hormaechei]SAC07724.1 Uncharacterised protein [Enterobacter hormaechei]SAD24590.1 Uncharacterised protein [Enterobacter hormaechei]SAE05116.1 Uncharacterised protein [Enterobacter hormaechei]SAE86123.1 Uncharacterised protein [Enterobacter hormaechei]
MGIFWLHNSAQICTIFLMLFMPFPPCGGAVCPQIGKCTKNEANVARR